MLCNSVIKIFLLRIFVKEFCQEIHNKQKIYDFEDARKDLAAELFLLTIKNDSATLSAILVAIIYGDRKAI